MKFGIRTPNIKTSIKNRTTGKIKRKIKGKVNPLYGKKGMGLVNDPEKAIYNKIYNKTSISALDAAKMAQNYLTDDEVEVNHQPPVHKNISNEELERRKNINSKLLLAMLFIIIITTVLLVFTK